MRSSSGIIFFGGVFVVSLTLFAGCGGYGGGGGSMYGGGGGGGGGATTFVGINLNGEAAVTDATYGMVLGYFNGSTSMTTTQVVNLTANTTVAFINLDSTFHTASFLGNASPSPSTWPASFASANNSGLMASAAGMAINTANFSTGPLGAGATSATYMSGPPGIYMIGCAYHYDSFGVRDIVMVH